jgi:rhamnogalacturonyl hydrolase YesR
MDELYWDAADYLYDPQEKLFYRDAKYFDARVNGKRVFWSRGQGWVVSGLVRILQDIPKDNPARLGYESLLRDMCGRLASLQSPDGMWRANLLDASQYPNPETSGSAFFIYAMAWGVNNGVLDRKTFQPIIRKGWSGLAHCVSREGKLGFVQQIGEDPRQATMNDSQEYGVGALLLAGGEVVKMSF